MRWVLMIYAVGVLLALWRTDAALPTRVAIALLWPIGPIAFVVTVGILLAASVIAFPVVAVTTLAVVGVAWWLLIYS